MKKNAFQGNANLLEVVTENVENLIEIQAYAFADCFRLDKIKISPSCPLKKIGKAAFLHTAIQEFVFPITCKEIGEHTFRGCQSLQNLTSYLSTPPSLQEDAFYDIENLQIAKLYIPKGSKALYAESIGWKHIPNMIEFEVSSKEQIQLNDVNIGLQAKQLQIDNSKKHNLLIRIYNSMGKLLTEDITDREEIVYSLEKGLSILCIEDIASKIKISKKIVF